MPSSEDINTTRYLYNILKPIGITLLDHVIVADNRVISEGLWSILFNRLKMVG